VRLMLTETKPPATSEELHLLCVNTIRTLAMDAVEKANSGHPGAPMGAAATAFVLWTEFLKHNPAGVEVTTGPLGQGFATGVGMAMAERFLAHRYNRPGHAIVDHNIFGIVSDGDLMEGLSHEAASLAGHLGLGKIVYLYDSNDISIDGSTSLSFTENVGDRFRAYG